MQNGQNSFEKSYLLQKMGFLISSYLKQRLLLSVLSCCVSRRRSPSACLLCFVLRQISGHVNMLYSTVNPTQRQGCI